MWFVEKRYAGSAQHNIPVVIPFGRRCNRSILERTVATLIDRHEALRTGFVFQASILLQVISAQIRGEVSYADLRRVEAHRREQALFSAMEAEARLPIDVTEAPLMRVRHYRMGGQDDRLLIVLHHIIADAWSVEILLHEFNEIYIAYEQGRQPVLSPLRLQYADWAAWHRSKDHAATRSYWSDALAEAPSVLELTADRPRPAIASLQGETLHAILPREMVAEVEALAKCHAASPFVVYFAAYAILLSRTSGAKDILIGCPMTMREGSETEGIVGLFLNTLPLRARLTENPVVREFICQIKDMSTSAQLHAHMPLDELFDIARPERSTQHHPLFQTLFSYQAALRPAETGGSAPVGSMENGLPGTGTAKFDLSLLVSNDGDSVSTAWEYATDLFDASTIERLQEQYCTIVRWLCRNDDRPVCEALLSNQRELAEVVQWESAGRSAESEDRSGVCERFERQVAARPDAIALSTCDVQLTYRDLSDEVNRLARALVTTGVSPDDCVGILLRRDSMMIVAALAILRAGATCVPLSLDFPDERIVHIIANARLRHVVVDSEFSDRLPVSVGMIEPHFVGDAELPDMPPPQAAAYVLYTSGSTGKPKGVTVGHSALAAFLDWAESEFSPTERARVLASTSITFDISIFEILLPLTTGGTVVLVENILTLIDYTAPAISLINTVPSAMRELLLRWQPGDELRAINLAGEPLAGDLAAAIHAKCGINVTLRNLYGPTETTIYSTFEAVQLGTVRPSIGRPILGTVVRVLDQHLRRCPIGETGELYIAGDGLAHGYQADTAQTAERYLPDPFATRPGQRMYRTGDLARWNSRGTLDLLGRTDLQVKLRGFRIELCEIEAVMREHPAVVEAIAVLDASSIELHLAVFFTGMVTDLAELERHLRRRVPYYMVPGRIERIDALPRTASGKIDRKALASFRSEMEQCVEIIDTDDRIETMKQIFSVVLGLGDVQPTDNFFALGGSSLLAVRVIAQVEAVLGIPVSLGTLFADPTPAGLAAACADSSFTDPGDILPLRPRLT